MKFNRILSSVLVVVMLFSFVIASFPIVAAAEEAGNAGDGVFVKTDDDLTAEDAAEIIQKYRNSKNTTAYDMLASDLEDGYLDYVKKGNYVLYLNRYTGVVYYLNLLTGQMLTSNPIDPGYGGKQHKLDVAIVSQVALTYSTHAEPKKTFNYDSYQAILNGFKPVVSEFNGGIRIDYTIGAPAAIDLTPIALLGADMEEYIIKPGFANLAALMQEKLGDFDSAIIKKINENTPAKKQAKMTSYNPYLTDPELLKGDKNLYNPGLPVEEYNFYTDNISQVLSHYTKYARQALEKANANVDGYKYKQDPAYIEITNFVNTFSNIFNYYSTEDINIYNSDVEALNKNVPAMKETGDVGYIVKAVKESSSDVTIRQSCNFIGSALKLCCPGFTAELSDQIQERSGNEYELSVVPRFNCSLIYSINDDGTLSVDFPAESISFNEEQFIVHSISALPYFGCADMNNDGYVFVPDGSGSVIEFDDFYNSTNKVAFQYNEPIYGKDSCYATMTGSHNENVTMPVYGLINKATCKELTGITGNASVYNGYFAVVEEGAALATIKVASGGSTHKYATAYTVYTPYSYDWYTLDNGSSYLVVSDSRYEGSYKTRYSMLTDPAVAEAAGLQSYFATSYVGMAACYRSYLEVTGQISKNNTSSTNLPLYIEVLGSMDITEKFLTFPVTVSTPLTSFEDVQRMYNELSSKGESGTETAISNINFKLTGFANGGMYYTYPAKVRWESSLGGKKGLNALIDSSKTVRDDNNPDTNMGIYPDFDFLYINNTAAFDRVSNSKNGSKLVDNRYASKQTYSSVSRKYETLFAILVSTDGLDKLYDKFYKDYSKYELEGLSVSTLGSDLNSNFDDDNPINREQARKDVVALLDRMSDKYSLMTDLGNMYTISYVDHIVNLTIDSSHRTFSSYAVPFVGMVLHSYINYAGTPINYTGSVDYNILHSIENGASLYYILCTQNTNYLKDDEQLSKYFGVDYENWKGNIKEQYTRLNNAIGSLQNALIVDHKAVIAERIPNSEDMRSYYLELVDEFMTDAEKIVYKLIDTKLKEFRADENTEFGLSIFVDFDKASLKEYAMELMNLTSEELNVYGFDTKLDALIASVKAEYPADSGTEQTTVSFDSTVFVANRGAYDPKYVTDSLATDGDSYDSTLLTCDNGSVVLVTYYDSTQNKTVHFILNYNNYKVNVRVDNTIDKTLGDGETKVYTVGRCDFIEFGK